MTDERKGPLRGVLVPLHTASPSIHMPQQQDLKSSNTDQLWTSDRKTLQVFLEMLASVDNHEVRKEVLYKELLKELERSFRDIGLGETAAREFARVSMADFNEDGHAIAEALGDINRREIACKQVATAVAELRKTVAASFEKAAILSLPSKAPAVWRNKKDREPGETPVTFLRRVWGPYMDAGILYQDDIKRLGDDKLVQTIRSYCQKHPEFKAGDVLPPPRKARFEQALATEPPDSTAARLIKRKMRDREAMARQRASPRARI